jgi:hypothetical protein
MKHIIIFLALVGSGTPLLFAQTPSPQWNPDYDGNGAITILDVLGVLSVFEEVDSDGDGVWDTNDPCVGALDVWAFATERAPIMTAMAYAILSTIAWAALTRVVCATETDLAFYNSWISSYNSTPPSTRPTVIGRFL